MVHADAAEPAPPPPDPRRLTRRRAWARLVLTGERWLTAAAPALGTAAIFLSLGLLGVWGFVPGWFHAVGLVASICLVAYLAQRGWRRFVAVDEAAVDRRLEAVAALRHQPLRALADRPAGTLDPAGATLWEAHQRRERARIEALRFVGPKAVLAVRDPWALRAVIGLVLVIALVDAGPSWRQRLADAFMPRLALAGPVVPIRMEVWLTPPLYTGQAPLLRSVVLPLTEPMPTAVVPVGSELVVQLHEVAGPEEVSLRLGTTDLEAVALGPSSVEAQAVVRESGALSLGADPEQAIAALAIEIIPDRSPTIAFTAPPEATTRSALSTRFEAEDDYGVAAIELEIALAIRPEEVQRIPLRTFGRPRPAVESQAIVDLTPHPFAGQPVVARLVATDVADQEGASADMALVLPERVFQHPLARAIIASRKRLVAEPDERLTVAAELNILAQSPRTANFPAAVPLSLRVASTRLVLNDDGSADRSVVDLLWEVALHVEDGQLSLAERDLRDIERALQEALERGADEAEIQALLDELEQAIEAFLDALQEQALQQLQNGDPDSMELQPFDPNARMVDRQDFQEMMDALRDAMESGATEQAQQMLAQLRQLLENLQTAMQMPMGASQAQQNMSALQEMIRRQQELMDQSFQLDRQGQQGQQGQQQPGQQGQRGQGEGGETQSPGDGGSEGLAAQQEALRRALGELMRQLGEGGQGIPQTLGAGRLAGLALAQCLLRATHLQLGL
ncbi:MAG: DUF4175 family protein, partial [Pseudomonadota bacterium]